MTTRRSFLQLAALAPFGFRLIQRATSMHTLYVGTYTDGDSEGIYRCRFDTESGALEMVEATGGIENPSFLAVDPSGSHLYAVSESGGGSVFAYAVDPAMHALSPLNSVPAHGGAPCYVSVTPDGAHVLIANYMGGNVAVYRRQDDGRLSEALDVVQHEGSGPNEQRQEAPHAHCILPHDGRAFAVDLGIDKVIVYEVREGALETVGSVSLQPGAGPRHITFHPNGRWAYVINELDSTVTVFAYDDGVLEPKQTITTLPADYDGENSCADIHVSDDGRFVYGSNRGHDSIVVYAVEGGKLSTVQHISTGGSWPRNFALHPGGRFLLVANQRSNDVVVFERDAATGRLTRSDNALDVPSPVCLRFL